MIALSSATIGVGGTCTLNVTVTGTTAGLKNNTTGNVTSTNGGDGWHRQCFGDGCGAADDSEGLWGGEHSSEWDDDAELHAHEPECGHGVDGCGVHGHAASWTYSGERFERAVRRDIDNNRTGHDRAERREHCGWGELHVQCDGDGHDGGVEEQHDGECDVYEWGDGRHRQCFGDGCGAADDSEGLWGGEHSAEWDDDAELHADEPECEHGCADGCGVHGHAASWTYSGERFERAVRWDIDDDCTGHDRAERREHCGWGELHVQCDGDRDDSGVEEQHDGECDVDERWDGEHSQRFGDGCGTTEHRQIVLGGHSLDRQ